MKSETYPDWVWQPVQPTPAGVSTWHIGRCSVCGRDGPVTEPRDYGHPIALPGQEKSDERPTD